MLSVPQAPQKQDIHMCGEMEKSACYQVYGGVALVCGTRGAEESLDNAITTTIDEPIAVCGTWAVAAECEGAEGACG